MKAYLVHEYGDNASFVETEIDKPAVIPGHVLIAVKATSLNPIDHKILTLNVGINPELPAILHMDVAGVVEEVGDNVTHFKVGDEVYGSAGGLQSREGKMDGALADYMLADSRLIAHKPTTLDFAESAALPLVSITAWKGLFDRAHLKKDDHVLVHAGAGGVGHVAIQLAKQYGARVSTTVSTQEKADIARGFGADEIIYYRDEDVADYVDRLTNGEGFDIVFDTLGGKTLDASFAAAKMGGQVLGINGRSQHDLTLLHMRELSLHFVFMLRPLVTGQGREHYGHILGEIAKSVDAGKLKPLINPERFTFSQAGAAHALYASNKHIGKILLENI